MTISVNNMPKARVMEVGRRQVQMGRSAAHFFSGVVALLDCVVGTRLHMRRIRQQHDICRLLYTRALFTVYVGRRYF
jgi:hypothetical protein